MSSRSGRRLTTEQKKKYRQKRIKKQAGRRNRDVTYPHITPGYHVIHHAIEQFIFEYLKGYQPEQLGRWRIIRDLPFIPFITAACKPTCKPNFICWEAAVYADDLVALRFAIRTADHATLVRFGYSTYLSQPQDFLFRGCFSAPDFFDALTDFLDGWVPRFANPFIVTTE